MVVLTRNERLLLLLISKSVHPVPTFILNSAWMNESAVQTFNHLHKNGLVAPVDAECSAYAISAEGRKALILEAPLPTSMFDMTYRHGE